MTMFRSASYPVRRGASVTVVLVWLFLAALAATGLYLYSALDGDSFSTEGIAFTQATRGPFTFSVTEIGEVESARSVEIRCEVKSRGAPGATILQIVPEGTMVAAGDFIAQLDASLLELDLNEQQIRVHTSEAAMIKSENDHTTAKISKTEYLQGTFEESRQTIQNEIFLAEEDMRRAEQYLEYSERLAAKGYVTSLQLEADRFAVDKAKGNLETGRTKLRVLENFTKPKMITQLESAIESTYASWQSTKSSYELEENKLKEIKSQIASCRIVAPQAGQVKYANRRGHRGNDNVIIEAGAQVRQGQNIIELPDSKNMRIAADINEARTKYVRRRMAATIEIGSLSKMPMHGRVLKVFDYPEPSSFFSSNVKKYRTRISIDDPIDGLRPGLTAKVEILVESLDDALQVPLQSVLQHGDQYYCLQVDSNAFQLTKVKIGLSNQSTVVIENGLEEGAYLAENPRLYRDEVEWPDIVERASNHKSAAGGGIAEKQEEQELPARSRQGDKSGESGRPDPAQIVTLILQQLDNDGDGRLSKQEVAAAPERRREYLDGADSDGNGFISRDELMKGLAQQRGGPS